MQKIFIASDHAGYRLKEFLKNRFELIDCGTNNEEACDYPIFAQSIAEMIFKNPLSSGVLICGTGIGMSIAANRFPFIRAALCHNAEMTKLARQHNDANVLVLGAKIISSETAIECMHVFLNTIFCGGRHSRRLKLIDDWATKIDCHNENKKPLALSI